MKKHTPLSLISLALLSIATLSLAAEQDTYKHENNKTTAKEVRHDVADAAETIKNYTADKRDEAAKKAKAALDALDVRISALEARIDKNWEKMDKAARTQARSTLDALQKQRVEVAEWYGGLKNSTAEAWERTKKGFSEAYRSLRNNWEKAERKYRDDERK
ncbi:MAG TPA: hypothetical protein VEP67_00070 [Thiobacillaceae bacterium]|nr:hypothetical protein [Thiobacillaceae bacterium]